MRQFRSIFVCHYDGAHTATVYNALLPAGWVISWSTGVPLYYHNADHARLGLSSTPSVNGGRTDIYVFTDDYDNAVQQQNLSGVVPAGWIEINRAGVSYHFSSQANAEAWLTANP